VRLRAVIAAALVLIASPLPAAYAEEGPGYGGSADALSVTWVEPSTDESAPADTAPAETVIELGGQGAAVIIRSNAQPTLEPDRLQLQVNGLGFRAKSQVVIRVGDATPVSSRSDTAGSLNVAIDPALIGGTQPGLSVIAIGRGPSGTAVTLYGSVPPEPAGSGPMLLVPWLVLAVVLAGVAMWFRRRHAAGTPRAVTDSAA
jgi:hypothetical protein